MPWEKSFDVEEALERAGEVFWTKGFDATSMCDLLDAMGIQRGSFYATFGSKREIYDRALERYIQGRAAWFRSLIAGKSPRAGLEAVVRAILGDCSGPDGHRGCMVINCAIELAHSDEGARDAVKRSFAAHEKLFADLIRKGQDEGEISREIDPKGTAKAMLAMIVGMRVFSRSGSSRQSLRVLTDQILSLVDR